MDYLRTIKLGLGQGTPGQKACWMTALQAHIGGKWTDQCDCVDPVINELCIAINDSYLTNDEARTEDIMDFGLFAPIGTKGSMNDTRRRLFKLADSTIRFWVPFLAKFDGDYPAALEAESLPEIVDEESFNKVADLFAESGADNYLSSHYCDSNFQAIIQNLIVPVYVLDSRFGLQRNFLKEHVYPVLKELIEMGPCAPSEPGLPVCGVEKFQQLVGIEV